MENIHFFILSSFCLTSFLQYGKVGLNRIVDVSKHNKYQSPFIDDFGLYSSVFSQMELTSFQEEVNIPFALRSDQVLSTAYKV